MFYHNYFYQPEFLNIDTISKKSVFFRTAPCQRTYLPPKANTTDLFMFGDEVNGFHLNGEQMERFIKPLDRGPYFDTSATKNVTSLVGKTGHLNCRIKNLGNKTVGIIN